MTDTNTPDYQATLAGWWETAERGTPNPGDRVIERREVGEWRTFIAQKGDLPLPFMNRRILSRATPPTPAWDLAVAVVAHTSIPERRVFTPTGDGDWYDTEQDRYLYSNQLINPVPLIEARVTDEMVEAVRRVWLRSALIADVDLPEAYARAVVTAALGIGGDK